MRRAAAALRGFAGSKYAIFLVLAFAACLLLFKLTEAPPTWYDEGMIVQLAQNLALHGKVGTQTAPGVIVSGAYTSSSLPIVAPVALSFLAFGPSLFSARIVMVLFSLLLIFLCYRFAKKLEGSYAGLAAALLLATFATLYGDGKNVLGEVPGLVCFFTFLFYAHALIDERRETRSNAILAGLFFGLTLIAKPTFLVLAGAAGLAFIYICIRDRRIPPVTLIALGLAAALVPVAAWLLTQFDSGDSLARVLAFYQNPYQLHDLGAVMAKNLLRFATESTPLYLLGMLAVWAVSMAKLGKRLLFTEITAFLLCLLIVAAFLRTPGWYRYLFIAQITAAVYFAVACMRLSRATLQLPHGRRIMKIGAIVLVFGALAAQTYVLAFNSWIGQYYRADNSARMERYFAGESATTTWLVYDVPEAVLFLPRNASYYQYLSVNAGGHWELGAGARSVIASSTPDVILAPAGFEPPAGLFSGYEKTAEVAKFETWERAHTLRKTSR